MQKRCQGASNKVGTHQRIITRKTQGGGWTVRPSWVAIWGREGSGETRKDMNIEKRERGGRYIQVDFSALGGEGKI